MSKLPAHWLREVGEVLRDDAGVSFASLEKLVADSKHKDIKWALSKREHTKLMKALYELMLSRYPLMEVVWMEYADFVFRTEDSTAAKKVYELAFTYLPRSLDLWIQWCQFQLETQTSHEAMFACLERARLAIGDNYRAWTFYEGYLNFLKMVEAQGTVLAAFECTRDSHSAPTPYFKLLRLVVQIPLYDYLKVHELNFKMLERATPTTIKNFINPNELMEIHKVTYLDLLNDRAKFKSVKATLKKRFTELFIVVQYAAWKRYPYEAALKTPHFHPDRLLTRLELNKWRQYLEYSEVMGLKVATRETEVTLARNNKDWTDVLYNRCVAVAGNYHYFWIKWSNYHMNLNNSNKAKEVLERALLCMNGGLLTPESLLVRSRLIDLHILDGELMEALELAMKVVGNLNGPSQEDTTCVVDIWVKVLEILNMTAPPNLTDDMHDIIDKVLAKCSHSAIQLKFLVEVAQFHTIPKETIVKYLESINTSEAEKQTALQTAYFQDAISAEIKDFKAPTGWKCEYF